jgi:ClpP class serine protease
MWLLLQSIYDAIHAGQSSGVQFTADQVAEFAARRESDVMTVAGSDAEIHVNGVLTNAPDMFAAWFGGGNTTYPDIISALAKADADPAVKNITMRFDSGGGSVTGMFKAIDAIKAAKKPVKAIVGTMAASAAYGLASQADTIVADDRASTVGSIGVVVDAYVSDNRVSVTSTNAPYKRKDLKTEGGKTALRSELDQMAALLDEAIADGRGVSVDTVNADYGQGGILLADSALKAGMIDSINGSTTSSTPADTGGEQQESSMDLATLQAQHPALYAQVVGLGTAKERDRVNAHLDMGKAFNGMDIAAKAIAGGDDLTQGLQAKYFAAGQQAKQVDDRTADEQDAAAALNGIDQQVPNSDSAKDAAQAAALKKTAEILGVEVEGVTNV